MAVGVWRREKGTALVLHERFLFGVGVDPDDDDVRIRFTADRVAGVGPRVSEEHERLAADLIDRVAPRAFHTGGGRPPPRALARVARARRSLSHSRRLRG